jgi:hypothetical protein
MSESAAPRPRARRVLLVWAIAATVAAIIFGNTSLVLFVRLRQANAGNPRATLQHPSRNTSKDRMHGPASFGELQDSDVAGRYRFYERTNMVGTITLLPDHTIINKDGTTYQRYHWEIQPEGLLTMWQRADVLFDLLESPGVYVARASDGSEYRRIEKIEE